MSPEIEGAFRKWERKIKREKIIEPDPDQYVDRCHWSKTGWAVWNRDGGCTCRPAREPTSIVG